MIINKIFNLLIAVEILIAEVACHVSMVDSFRVLLLLSAHEQFLHEQRYSVDFTLEPLRLSLPCNTNEVERDAGASDQDTHADFIRNLISWHDDEENANANKYDWNKNVNLDWSRHVWFLKRQTFNERSSTRNERI